MLKRCLQSCHCVDAAHAKLLKMNTESDVINSRTLSSTCIGLLLVAMSSNALSLDEQWYFGVGGGVSVLSPEPDPNPGSIKVDDDQGVLGTLTFGRDIDDRSSAQLQLYSLGEAELTDGQTVGYSAVDASVLYRFYDTRGRQVQRGTALYGRFSMGFIDRDAEVLLSDNREVYFGLGGGAEFFLTRNIALRAEAYYHDQDVISAQLSLITRFGGRRAQAGQPPNIPVPEVSGPALPKSKPDLPSPGVTEELALPKLAEPLPEVIEPDDDDQVAQANNDSDNDGVLNSADACPSSAIGYPVGDTGCPLFDGVLSGVQFVDRTSELVEGASTQLEYLANLLKRYPLARIELLAHTDSRGDVRSQSILTRARLRTVGTYIVGQGVRANRLVLRSFGGTRPIYDNATSGGRLANNRIEVIEHLPTQ